MTTRIYYEHEGKLITEEQFSTLTSEEKVICELKGKRQVTSGQAINMRTTQQWTIKND
jgi:hypothetical protein